MTGKEKYIELIFTMFHVKPAKMKTLNKIPIVILWAAIFQQEHSSRQGIPLAFFNESFRNNNQKNINKCAT